MSEEEIIQIEYETIKKFCKGDRDLALRIISECGSLLRDYIEAQQPRKVPVEELFSVIEDATKHWEKSKV